jgi:hypothetical protein
MAQFHILRAHQINRLFSRMARQQVANATVDDPKERDDCGLVRDDRIEIAYGLFGLDLRWARKGHVETGTNADNERYDAGGGYNLEKFPWQ